jgi:hypothetical protein
MVAAFLHKLIYFAIKSVMGKILKQQGSRYRVAIMQLFDQGTA